MSKTSYQFIRLEGFRRGPASKRGTLGAIVAEGLRKPTHISHLPGAPRYEVVHLDGPVADPNDLPLWIEEEMASAKNEMLINGRVVLRSVRKDALAIGTMIASLPETLADFDSDRFKSFAEDTTDWAREFLSARDCVLHFRLEHLDELHPHIHLWFTPKGSTEREGNWTFSSVLGRDKGFLHQFQTGYFDAVGNKYFDARAKPYAEREKRIPRYFAVIKRDAAEVDVVKKINSDQLLISGDCIISEKLSSALNNIDDDLDRIPAINSRLVSLRDEIKVMAKRHEVELNQLRERLGELQQSNDELASKVESEKSVSPQNARMIFSKEIWEIIVKTVIESAHNNVQRALNLSVEDWAQLVIEDAFVDMAPLHGHTSQSVDEIHYWISRTVTAALHRPFSTTSSPSDTPASCQVPATPYRQLRDPTER